jgi:hypothetical protein
MSRLITEAEREGFEPSMDGTAHTGFRDRRIQPLCHLSGERFQRLAAPPASGGPAVLQAEPRRV